MTDYNDDDDRVTGDDRSHDEEQSKNDQIESKEKAKEEFKRLQDYASVETQRVFWAKMLVLLSILAIGAGVSVFTFRSLQDDVNYKAKDAFEIFATTIAQNWKFQVSNIFKANRFMSRVITTASFVSNKSFPFVEVPAFEAYAHEARVRGGFEVVMYAPLVKYEETSPYLDFRNKALGWVEESRQIYDKLEPGANRSAHPPAMPQPPVILNLFSNGTATIVSLKNDSLDFSDLFMTSPPPRGVSPAINLHSPGYRIRSAAHVSAILQDTAFTAWSSSHFDTSELILGPELHGKLHDERSSNVPRSAHPHCMTVQPVYRTLAETERPSNADDIVGFIYSIMAWQRYLIDLLPDGVKDIQVVIRNSCNQSATYELDGSLAHYVGDGNLHETKYDPWAIIVDFSENYRDPELAGQTEEECQVFLDIYPTSKFEESYKSKTPVTFTIGAASLFVVMVATFVLYDMFVSDRNKKVLKAAARSNVILGSLFPSAVRDKLLAEEEEKANVKGDRTMNGFLSPGNQKSGDDPKTAPIADFFPNVTILFADVSGFTAWSSIREPGHVFRLLETLYNAFDRAARRRRVFKVETIGDCYVAVTGLPEPCKDHAVVMARFARDCLTQMAAVVNKLDSILGPGTADLGLRVGLHSGPVTAGVLRGEKSRFQLFGDTMNTASRMESNGLPGRIHVSSETAKLLEGSGKGEWLEKRPDNVHVKGKGTMETYWLSFNNAESSSVRSGTVSSSYLEQQNEDKEDGELLKQEQELAKMKTGKNTRLIDWNVEVLLRHLKHMAARRQSKNNSEKVELVNDEVLASSNKIVFDEVKEIVYLPQKITAINRRKDYNTIELSDQITAQVRDFVTSVCYLYKENPFHNFEHASHVTMSVCKLLQRIVADNDGVDEDHTYGITQDPLTQFSCVFSALIHDLDHPGVPNAQLVQEKTEMAVAYNNKSIAEQNSVNLAFRLLAEDKYKDFRRAIYTNQAEMDRFRQLVINAVMATDIVDKELKALRNARWNKAFSDEGGSVEEHIEDRMNRKATIVIEHLIQASDVAHTMQHWHVYRKWNERFFLECHAAYKVGRVSQDPSLNWYNGEIGFFDFYVIPLAKKLKECGVFGVSSDEYLTYAKKNRQEWEIRGREVVDQLMQMVATQDLAVAGSNVNQLTPTVI